MVLFSVRRFQAGYLSFLSATSVILLIPTSIFTTTVYGQATVSPQLFSLAVQSQISLIPGCADECISNATMEVGCALGNFTCMCLQEDKIVGTRIGFSTDAGGCLLNDCLIPLAIVAKKVFERVCDLLEDRSSSTLTTSTQSRSTTLMTSMSSTVQNSTSATAASTDQIGSVHESSASAIATPAAYQAKMTISSADASSSTTQTPIILTKTETLSTGAKVGIAAALVAWVFSVILSSFFILRRRRQKRARSKVARQLDLGRGEGSPGIYMIGEKYGGMGVQVRSPVVERDGSGNQFLNTEGRGFDGNDDKVGLQRNIEVSSWHGSEAQMAGALLPDGSTTTSVSSFEPMLAYPGAAELWSPKQFNIMPGLTRSSNAGEVGEVVEGIVWKNSFRRSLVSTTESRSGRYSTWSERSPMDLGSGFGREVGERDLTRESSGSSEMRSSGIFGPERGSLMTIMVRLDPELGAERREPGKS